MFTRLLHFQYPQCLVIYMTFTSVFWDKFPSTIAFSWIGTDESAMVFSKVYWSRSRRISESKQKENVQEEEWKKIYTRVEKWRRVPRKQKEKKETNDAKDTWDDQSKRFNNEIQNHNPTRSKARAFGNITSFSLLGIIATWDRYCGKSDDVRQS